MMNTNQNFPSTRKGRSGARRRRRNQNRQSQGAMGMAPIPRQMQVSTRSRRPARSGNQARTRDVELIPSAVINRSRTLAPRITSRGANVVISHSEYFRTLSSGVAEAFSVQLLNPCNSNLFPWLSLIAPSWERYRFHALNFVFKTSCSTTFAGDLAMVIDYDARDPLPTTFGEFSSNEGCVTGNYYGNLSCPALIKNLDKRNRGWYLTAESEKTTELAEFYGGNFETYTSAATAAQPVGKLYVEYVIELNNPQARDTNGLTTGVSADAKTINVAANLVGNLISQGGAVTMVGNDVTVDGNGITFLKGGDYDISAKVSTVTDTATLTNSLTSENGTLSMPIDVHATTEDQISRLVRVVNVATGDRLDWTVGVANLALTALYFAASRYKSTNYL